MGLKEFFAKPKEAPPNPGEINPLEGVRLLTQAGIIDIVKKLDVDRILRTMMLHDIRWVNEEQVSFIPDESQIIQEMRDIVVEAIIKSRQTGQIGIVSRKGFKAVSYITANKFEMLHLSFVLSEGEGSSLQC